MPRALDLRHALAPYPRGFQFPPEAHQPAVCETTPARPRGLGISWASGGPSGSMLLTEVRASLGAAFCLPGGGTGQTMGARRLRIPPGAHPTAAGDGR
jgi:hypothetical protein